MCNFKELLKINFNDHNSIISSIIWENNINYCFWSDKDYIYRWEYSYNDKIYHIIRDKKMTDFKVLSTDEII